MQFFFLLFAPTQQSTTYAEATTEKAHEATTAAGKSNLVPFEADFSEGLRNYVN